MSETTLIAGGTPGDVAIVWNPEIAGGDWEIRSGDLALGNPLLSSILVSLFTDGLAPAEPSTLDAQIGIAAPANRRGWWGDAYSEDDTTIGSRLWQARQVIKSGVTAIPAWIEATCEDALQWLMDDGVASSVSVDATWMPGSATTIQFVITITQPATQSTQVFRFSWAWEGLL